MAHKDDQTAVLDRMLDELKTTVGSDNEMTDGRDGSLVSSFRSSSRNEARSGSRAGSRSSSAPAATVEDGGHVRHTRHEYRTPDNKTHVVTEKYEYDTGDTSKTKNYQKKVMKSTYSTFNSMSAGSVDDPPAPAPQVSPPAPHDTKVISASQKVANKLVDALSSIGDEGVRVSTRDSCDSDSFKRDTIRSSTTSTITTDYTTLGRLRKNINELDTIINSLETTQPQPQPQPQPHVTEGQKIVEVRETIVPAKTTVIEKKAPPPETPPQISPTTTKTSTKKVVRMEEMNPDPMETAVSIALASAKQSTTTVTTTKRVTESHGTSSPRSPPKVPREEGSTTNAPRPRTSSLTNGTYTSSTSNKYDNEDFDDAKNGEVRRIVWRNRFEKTYETQDSTNPPSMTIEDEARRRETLQRQHHTSTSASTTSTLSSPPQRGPVSPRVQHLQCAVYWPGYAGAPHVSPGSQSWKEPIPMPTPPQVSPREPGVAYIYTYGNETTTTGKSSVQPLPPINYVNVPSAQSVPASDGAPSPTPSSQAQTQPIIYHYSYHYTIQPGQPLPDGAPPPPAGLVSGSPPALQVASPSTHSSQHSHHSHNTHTTTTHTNQSGHPSHITPPGKPNHVSPVDHHPGQPGQSGQPGQPSSSINYNIHSYSNRTVNRTNTTNVDHSGPHGPGGPGGPYSPDGRPIDDPGYPRKPREPGSPEGPDRPGHPGSYSITINKTTTRTTHSGGHPGSPDGDVPPLTSTPYSSRGRSVSPEPRTPGSPQHVSYVTNVSRTSYSDSLERVRRPKNETLPFPNTSPIKPQDNTKIPRRVDDLMTSFSDSEDGPGVPIRMTRRDDPADHEPLLPNNNQVSVKAEADAKAVAAAETKVEPTKNKVGPPVYYPPGHDFHETMHTMTLKEGRRRGKAKWRMERSAGYNESSSHSESKGGMAMVPVCLPLCCGAGCVIM